MTGHLLQTVNPEAAAEEHEVPPIGARVQFFAKPGFGRGGKNIFPAEILHADPKTGVCAVYVLFGPEDWREYPHVRRRSEQEPMHCWDFMPDGFDELADELEATKRELAEVKAALFGDYEAPQFPDGRPKSIIDILAEFEQKVFAAQKAAAAKK